MGLYAPYFYDGTMLIAAAMKAADSTDPAKYLPALAKIKYPGITANFEFDGNGDLQGFVKDGTLEAIAVQSAYQMGSLGVKTVAEIVEGKKVPRFRDTGVLMVNKKNIDTQEAKNVLY